jgi:hypothetical protein
MQNRSDSSLKRNIEKRLDLINTNKKYTNIIIADLQGKILINLGDTIDKLDKSTLFFVNQIIGGNQIVFTDFYPCETHKTLHIDYLAPIVNSKNNISAVLIFRVNPYHDIYPILEEWDTPGENAKNYILEQGAIPLFF